jgi:outer membrane immunogenic protein
MKKLLGTIAVLAAAMPLAANAADLPAAAPAYKAPVVAPVPYFSWTGCYLGGNGGGAWEKASHTFDNGAGIVEGFSYSPSSWIAGGQVGCQYQWSSFVAGIEGTWSATDLKQTDTSVIDPNRTRSLKLDEIATVVGKVGFAWDRALIYAKGGWADGHFNYFAINNATGVNGGFTNWQSGWTAGGGVEYMVIPNLILGVEFDYYNFKYDNNFTATDGSLSRVFNSNANVYAVTGRASWLFNWGGPVVARY